MNFCGSRTSVAPLPDGREQHEDESRGALLRTRTRARRRDTRRTVYRRSPSGSDDSGGRSCPTGAGTSGAGAAPHPTAVRAPVAVAATRFTPTAVAQAAPVAAPRRAPGGALAAAPARRRPALAVWRRRPGGLVARVSTDGAAGPSASKAGPRAAPAAWRPPVAVVARTPAAVAVAAAQRGHRRHNGAQLPPTAFTIPSGPVGCASAALPRRRSPRPPSESMDTTPPVRSPSCRDPS